MSTSTRGSTSIRTGPDLISSLPDPILHHILGFLKTRQAIQTCVLSKRWEHLWTSLRSLYFDRDDFRGRVQLSKFVNAVLLRRELLDLDAFHLCREAHHCWESYKQAMNWIRYAVKHQTRALHLSDFYPFQSCIFTCTSIEEHLTRGRIRVSGTLNLPKLRKLVISHNDFPFPKNLVSGCPVLEHLELNCYMIDECLLANEYLKHLSFDNCSMKRLIIDAPNLLSFSFNRSYTWFELGVPPPRVTILDMSSLMFARFDTSCIQMCKHMEAVTSMLGTLSNAELLKVYIDCDRPKAWLIVQLQELPIFYKLKDVTITFCAFASLKMVAWILDSSPNLKKITLVKIPYCCVSEEEWNATTCESYDSLMDAITSCKDLEIIEDKYKKGCAEMVGQFVDALIEDTEDLENLKINISKFNNRWPYFEWDF